MIAHDVWHEMAHAEIMAAHSANYIIMNVIIYHWQKTFAKTIC